MHFSTFAAAAAVAVFSSSIAVLAEPAAVAAAGQHMSEVEYQLFKRQTTNPYTCQTTNQCKAADFQNNYNFLNALGDSSIYIIQGYPQQIAKTNNCSIFGYLSDSDLVSSSSPSRDFGGGAATVYYNCVRNGVGSGKGPVINNANIYVFAADFSS